MQDPPLWGLKTVVTEAIAQGTVLVGAFKLGGAVIRKGGLRAESTNSHADDFTFISSRSACANVSACRSSTLRLSSRSHWEKQRSDA